MINYASDIKREADRQTNGPTDCRESDIQKFNRQTVRQSDGQTFRQLDSQAVRPLDRNLTVIEKEKNFFIQKCIA